MPGVAIVVELSSFAPAIALLSRMAAFDPTQLMTEIGALGESQTRRRIESEKTSPDGAAWPPNLAGTSILMATGRHLHDSIAYIAGASQVEWGASWEFAHVHQDGAVISAKSAAALHFKVGDRWVKKKSVAIPARPFVGLSGENRTEIEELVTDHLGRLAP